MKKDYSEWHKKKSDIEHNNDTRVFSMNAKFGGVHLVRMLFEQDGKGGKFARPVLVFKKFNKEVFWALPLSTRIKER